MAVFDRAVSSLSKQTHFPAVTPSVQPLLGQLYALCRNSVDPDPEELALLIAAVISY